MAYNKSKFVESAQKLLNQGKSRKAIAEYQQILKYDPRIRSTLMTIGELYIRQGELFRPSIIRTPRADFVAMVFSPRRSPFTSALPNWRPKNSPARAPRRSLRPAGRNERSAPLFLQLAEIHLKNNRQPEAVSLLKKLLLAERTICAFRFVSPIFTRRWARVRKPLRPTFQLRSVRSLAPTTAECEKLADKALKLDPPERLRHYR